MLRLMFQFNIRCFIWIIILYQSFGQNEISDTISKIQFEWRGKSVLESNIYFRPKLSQKNVTFYLVFSTKNTKVSTQFTTVPDKSYSHNVSMNTTFSPNECFLHFKVGNMSYFKRFTVKQRYLERYSAVGVNNKYKLLACQFTPCDSVENILLYEFSEEIQDIAYGDNHNELFIITGGVNKLIKFSILNGIQTIWKNLLSLNIKKIRYDWLNKVIYMTDLKKIYKLQGGKSLKLAKLKQIYTITKQHFIKDIVVDPIGGYIHIIKVSVNNQTNQKLFDYEALYLKTGKITFVNLQSKNSGYFMSQPFALSQTSDFEISFINTTHLTTCNWYSNNCTSFGAIKPAVSSVLIQKDHQIIGVYRYEHGYLIFIMDQEQYFHLEKHGRSTYSKNSSPGMQLSAYTNKMSSPRRKPDAPTGPEWTNTYFAADKVIVSFKQPEPSSLSTYAWRRWSYKLDLSVLVSSQSVFLSRPKTINSTMITGRSAILGGLKPKKHAFLELKSGVMINGVSGISGRYNLSMDIRILTMNPTDKLVQIWSYSFSTKTIKLVKNYILEISEFSSLHELKDGSMIGLKHGVLMFKSQSESTFEELERNVLKYEIETNSQSIYWLSTKGEIYSLLKFCNPSNKKRLITKGAINNFLLVGTRLIIIELQNGNKLIKCGDLHGQGIKDGRRWCYQKGHDRLSICKDTPYYWFYLNLKSEAFVRYINKIGDSESFRCFVTGYGFLETLPNKDNITLYSSTKEASLKIPLSTKKLSYVSVLEPSREPVTCPNITKIQQKELNAIKLNIDLYPPKNLVISWNKPLSSILNRTDFNLLSTIGKFTIVSNYNETKINLTDKFSCAEKINIILDLNSKYSSLYTITDSKIIPCFTTLSKLQNLFLLMRPIQKPSLLQLEFSLDLPEEIKKINSKNLNCFLMFQLMDGSEIRVVMRLKIITVNCQLMRPQKIFEISKKVILEDVDKTKLCVYYIITRESSIEYLNVSQLPHLKTCVTGDILKSTHQKIFLQTNQKFIFYRSKVQPIKTIQINSNNQLKLSIENTNHTIRHEELAFINDSCLNTSSKSYKLEVDWLGNRLFVQNNCNQELVDINFTNGISRNWYQFSIVQSNLKVLERRLEVSTKAETRIFDISLSKTGWRSDLKALDLCNRVYINQPHIACLDNSNDIAGYFVNDPTSNTKMGTILKNWDNAERRCMIVAVSKNYKLDKVAQCSLTSTIPGIVMNIAPNVWLHKNGGITRQPGLVEAVDPNTNKLHGVNLWCDRKSISISSEFNKLQQIVYNQKNNQSTTINLVPNQKLYVIKDLSPATEFKFQIQINKNSINLSANCTTSVDVPDQIENIYPIKTSPSHLEISWDPLVKDNGSPIEKYKIEIDLLYNNDAQTLTKYSNTTYIKVNLYEFNISRSLNLIESNTFVRIAPINAIGEGSWKSINAGNVFNPSNLKSLLTLENVNQGTTIVMITVALIILIILMIIAILIVYTKLHPRQSLITPKLLIPKLQQSSNNEHVLELNCLYNITEGNSDFNIPLSDFDKIPHFLCEKIRFIQLIGKGAFGSVFKGTLQVSVRQNDERIGDILEDVALKMRNEESVSETEFKREAVLMWRYAHPYIVRLLGVTFDRPDRQSLILEYMERGNLRDYLRRKRRITSTNTTSMVTDSKSSRGSCSSATLHNNAFANGIQYLDTAFDVLKALVYLEENRFIHRDIAARNCLVSHRISQNRGDRITKLGDFGLSRDTYDQGYYRHIPTHSEGGDDNTGASDWTKKSSNKVVGVPVKWMAPETLKDNVYSGASDVWAWAVLCWEVLSMGAEPYSGRGNREVVGAVVGGETPGKAVCAESINEGGLRQNIEAIMNRCWRYYPEDRPTFREIENQILHMNKSDFSNFPPPAEEEPEPMIPMPSEYTDIVFRSDSLQVLRQAPSTTSTNVVMRSQVSSISNDTTNNGSAYMNNNYDNDGYEKPLLHV